MQMGQTVFAKTADGQQKGKIIGRTFNEEIHYDIRVDRNQTILVNVPASHIKEVLVEELQR